MIEPINVVALKTRGNIKADYDYTVIDRMVGAVKLEGLEGWFPETWFRQLFNLDYDLAGNPLNDTANPQEAPLNAKDKYLQWHEQACQRMIEITRRKNHDYTGTNADPFANFRAVESAGICTTIQGFLVRMTDKLARVNSFSQKGVLKVADESVEDTLLDLANYSLLLAGYIREEKERERGKTENADTSNGDEIPL